MHIYTDSQSSNAVPVDSSQPVVPPVTRGPPLVPDLLSLLEDVAVKAPDKFKYIGLKLGFSNSELNAIKMECNSIQDCFCEIFQKWEERTSPPYTWETMIDVLESPLIKRKDLAEQLRRKFGLTLD